MLTRFLPALLFADEAPGEAHPCTYIGHTPAGTVAGNCTTPGIPAQGFISRWKLTLTCDVPSEIAAAKIKPDAFFDVVRSQCVEDGTFTVVTPLWGDFVLRPDDAGYIRGTQVCAPAYQVSPSVIALSWTNTNPPAIQFLFEVRPVDFDPVQGVPTFRLVRPISSVIPRLADGR